MVLTIISIATEELMEAHEIRPSTKFCPFCDQNLSDKFEVVDYHTGGGTKGNAENVSIGFTERSEGLERTFVFGE